MDWNNITLLSKMFSIYHLVPFLFVLGILFSVIMAFVNVPIFVYLLTSAYLLFNILNIILITIKMDLVLAIYYSHLFSLYCIVLME